LDSSTQYWLRIGMLKDWDSVSPNCNSQAMFVVNCEGLGDLFVII
jgi:hypothetical protein